MVPPAAKDTKGRKYQETHASLKKKVGKKKSKSRVHGRVIRGRNKRVGIR